MHIFDEINVLNYSKHFISQAGPTICVFYLGFILRYSNHIELLGFKRSLQMPPGEINKPKRVALWAISKRALTTQLGTIKGIP